tara:strand:- start:1060 stop:1890 length:831 start_codon:yes stop_codon:yes gene_type:complete
MASKKKSLMRLVGGGGAGSGHEEDSVANQTSVSPTFRSKVFGTGVVPEGMSVKEFNESEQARLEKNNFLEGDALKARMDLAQNLDQGLDLYDSDQRYALSIAMGHFGVQPQDEGHTASGLGHDMDNALSAYASGQTRILQDSSNLQNARFTAFLDAYSKSQRILRNGVTPEDLVPGQTVGDFMQQTVDPFTYSVASGDWIGGSGSGPEFAYEANMSTGAQDAAAAFEPGFRPEAYGVADFDPKAKTTEIGAKKLDSLMQPLLAKPYNPQRTSQNSV